MQGTKRVYRAKAQGRPEMGEILMPK